MTFKIGRIFILIVLFLSFALSAHAATALTSDEVQRVLNTLDSLEPYFDRLEEEQEQTGEFDAEIMSPDMFNNECELIYGYCPESKKIIESNGFTQESWQETAPRVMKALTYLSMQEEGVAEMQEMEAALSQIEADPSMSPQQKAALKTQVQIAINNVQQIMKAPEGDVEAVRPFYNKSIAE